MIKQEIQGKYTYTYSDVNKYIERDGIKYESAMDKTIRNRVYTETDEDIPAREVVEQTDDMV